MINWVSVLLEKYLTYIRIYGHIMRWVYKDLCSFTLRSKNKVKCGELFWYTIIAQAFATRRSIIIFTFPIIYKIWYNFLILFWRNYELSFIWCNYYLRFIFKRLAVNFKSLSYNDPYVWGGWGKNNTLMRIVFNFPEVEIYFLIFNILSFLNSKRKCFKI